MENTTETEVLRLESETCGRCGGSGHYSYCQSYGTTCFKCRGVKRIFTKRGAAAHAFFTAKLSKRADQLQVGDKVWEQGGPLTSAGWAKVIEIRPDLSQLSIAPDSRKDLLWIETENINHGGVTPEEAYRVAATHEQKVAAMREAIAFQETLTKQGTPKKRKAAN